MYFSGSYLFKHVMGHSYTRMFLLSGGIMVVAFLYALLRLEWCTNETKNAAPISCLNTVGSTIRVITKSRPNSYAVYLRLVIFAMAVYTFQRGRPTVKCLVILFFLYFHTHNFEDYNSELVAQLMRASPLSLRCLECLRSSLFPFLEK